ncbi:hypothetical protein Fmac_008624 [Flemingia macrophylla]|uniref:Rhodanese domain-containing protein n=1 Tax=Flemingia macrophylla TaxID=520843 RepID=A0ABD1MXW1_9FABA
MTIRDHSSGRARPPSLVRAHDLSALRKMKFPVALVSSPHDFDSLWPSHPPRPTALPSPTAPPQQLPWSPPAILILSGPVASPLNSPPSEVSHRFHSLVPLHPYSHRDLELHPYSHRDSHRLWPVDSSIRKLLKGGRDLYDSLIAAIIRNLKIVKDSSGVIVLDADGTRSKGIARSLRKIGVKASLSIPATIFANPYVVQGGFQSWTKQGIRIKELKPETALSILNEEAEAILEDVSPSPLQLLGYGTVSVKSEATSCPGGSESTSVDPINEEKLRNKSWIDVAGGITNRGRLYGVGKVGSALRLGDAFPNLSCGRSTQESEKILRLEQAGPSI